METEQIKLHRTHNMGKYGGRIFKLLAVMKSNEEKILQLQKEGRVKDNTIKELSIDLVCYEYLRMVESLSST